MASPPPSSVQAGSGFGLTVDVEDAYGNPVTTASNSVTLSLSGATLGGTLTVAATGGVATFSGLSIDQAAGGYTIEASSGGLSAAATGSVDVTAASATQIVISSQPAATVTAGSPIALTADVEDAYGNVVTNFSGQVTLTLTDGHPRAGLVGAVSTTVGAGVISFSGLTIDQAGTGYAIEATSAGLTSATSDAFAVTPAAPATLVIEASPPSSLTAGESFGLSVAVEDAYGNLVTDDAGDISIGLAGGPTGGVLDGTASEPVVDGLATFSGLDLTEAGSAYAIEATGAGLTSALSNPMTVTPASPAQLVIVQTPPSSVAAGSPFGLAVAIEDAYGNVVSSSDADVSLGLMGNAAGAGLGGGTTAAAISGVATFERLTLNASGPSYQIQASSTGLSGATTTVGVTPASATRLVITVEPPASVTAGSGFGLGVSIEDGFGNPVTGYSGPVTVSVVQASNGDVLSGATTIQASGGSASFSGLTIDQAGDDLLEVSAAGVGALPTTAIQVVPAAPSRLVMIDAPPGQITAGQVFGVTAAVEDAFGNVESGFSGTVTVALASNAAGGSLSGPVSVTAVNGVAEISGLTIDTAGSGYAVGVNVPGLASADSAPIAVVPSAPTRLIVILQPPNRVSMGRPFAVGVEALDAFGNVATGFDGTVTASLGSGPGARARRRSVGRGDGRGGRHLGRDREEGWVVLFHHDHERRADAGRGLGVQRDEVGGGRCRDGRSSSRAGSPLDSPRHLAAPAARSFPGPGSRRRPPPPLARGGRWHCRPGRRGSQSRCSCRGELRHSIRQADPAAKDRGDPIRQTGRAGSMRGLARVAAVVGMFGTAIAGDPASEGDVLLARLVHPDRQAQEVLKLFEGARWRDPAAALADWKRRSPANGLGKEVEAVIALFNPEMAREWSCLDEAELRVGVEPATGALGWSVLIPRDDGTLAAAVTAMQLTDPDDRPLAIQGNTVPVARLGRSGVPLACQVGSAIVVASSRDRLERAAAAAIANPGRVGARLQGIGDSGTLFSIDPSRLATAARSTIDERRLLEFLRAIGCRGIEGAASLHRGSLRIELSTRCDVRAFAAGRGVDVAWLDAMPTDGVMAALAVAIDPAGWDRAFAAADRIERIDPARATSHRSGPDSISWRWAPE